MNPFKAAGLALNLLFLASALTALVGYERSRGLPPPEEILPVLESDPIQRMANEPPFEFDYRGTRYTVTPVARYELRGLVVTHNDIAALSDIYHNEESVDFRDICVIWGDNVVDSFYQRLSFWSEPWTCYVQSKSSDDWRQFEGNQLSNNHLLTNNEQVQQAVEQAHIGDQILLRGMLVNYAPSDRPSFLRKSSTSRDDTGNGACEVVFVEEFAVLKPYQPGAYSLLSWGTTMLVVTGVLNLLAFGALPYLEYKFR